MPPVKPNNQITRKTRAQNRILSKQSQSDIEKPQNKIIKSHTSQTKSHKSANDTASDTEQPTISTGINNRKQAQIIDAKLTVKKNNFQSKPIIKDVAKRINNYSKQFTPEYFTTILEYMIERQSKSSMSPTAQRVAKWREFIDKKNSIEDLVRKQVKKVRNMIITSRKKFQQDKEQEMRRNKINQNNIKQGYKINHESIEFDDEEDEDEENDEFDYEQQEFNNARNNSKNSNLSHALSIVANQHPTSQVLPNAPQKSQINGSNSSNPNNVNFQSYFVHPNPTNSSSSHLNQSKSSYWLPSSVSEQSSSPKPHFQQMPNPKLTQQQLNKEWDTRFDTFAVLIQSVYDLLGQNECLNTIFPACYILYTMITSDIRVFNYLSKDSIGNKQNPTYNHRSFDGSGYPHRSSISKSSPPQMLEYYIVVSLLIATKYHQIYPASLIDMIQSINVSLSVDKALKIECQILEMLNFSEYFNDHEIKFLKMFIIVAGWTNNEMNVCQFILESGLNNPKLYRFSPMHKAAVAIGLYEQKFFKTQEKFMKIKTICPGLSLDLATQIKKEYQSIIIYNHKNEFNMQKKKFFIFDKEMKNLIKKPNINGAD